MYSDSVANKYSNAEKVSEYKNKISSIQEKVLEKLKYYEDKSKTELTSVDATNMGTESIRNIDLLHKFMSILSQEKIILENYKSQKEKIEGELFDFYRNHSDISSKLKSESAISKYVYAHSTFQEINKLVKTQLAIVEYLESLIIVIRDRGFAIKNYIEVKKIELGL